MCLWKSVWVLTEIVSYAPNTRNKCHFKWSCAMVGVATSFSVVQGQTLDVILCCRRSSFLIRQSCKLCLVKASVAMIGVVAYFQACVHQITHSFSSRLSSPRLVAWGNNFFPIFQALFQYSFVPDLSKLSKYRGNPPGWKLSRISLSLNTFDSSYMTTSSQDTKQGNFFTR